MTDFTRSFEIFIHAPVQTVFEYCRDPRRVVATDAKLEVRDVTLTPEGLGSTAHLVAKGVVTDDAGVEFIEFVPGRRIVWKSRPTISIAGMAKEITHGPTWTWTFAGEGEGTKLGLVFCEVDPPWWQRAFDLVTERSWSKQVRGWLAGIKAAVEEQVAPAQ